MTVVPKNKGKVLKAFDTEITVFLGSAETDGKYTVFSETTPPGGGPPPHFHDNEDEWFFPLEGRVEFLIDGAWQEVPMGTVVFAPRGTTHTFRNPGDEPLRMLMQTAPAGFEVFFERCAEVFASADGPDMDRIGQIAGEHGIHFVEP